MRWKKKGAIGAVTLALASLSFATAQAASISYEFAGTSFSGPAVPITGTFTIDNSVGALGAVESFSFSADNFLGSGTTATGQAFHGNLGLLNDYDLGAITDRFAFYLGNSQGSTFSGAFDGAEFSLVQFTLDSLNLAGLSSSDPSDLPNSFVPEDFFPPLDSNVPGTSDDVFIEFGSNVEHLQITSVSQLATVPLPPALPLFLSGLGGLGFLGWRRKRAAAA